MRDNQKGFSLVELVVVIAIMAIVGGIMVLSFSTVLSQNAKSCATQIETYLGQTRTQAMSRRNTVMYLYTTSAGVYVQIAKTHDNTDVLISEPAVKIAKEGTVVSYALSDDPDTLIPLTAGGDKLEISFNRSSGAFKPIPGTGGAYCQKIVIASGGKEVTLVMVPMTGKYYIQ